MIEEKMIEEQMEISLENVLPSLAQSLYGNDWRISIRELLQNCNDANIEAQIFNRRLENTSLVIRIISNREQGTLTIQDEGIGMTLEEVKKYLATVGYGKKRQRLEEIKHDPKNVDYDLIKNIIGQFGIGFLASFIIANKVEVITKSRKSKEPAQRCLFSGETKWYHERYQKEMEPGTIVTLYLKADYSKGEVDLLNPSVLGEVISKFGDLIPYPIYRCDELNESGGDLLNTMKAPWEKGAVMQGELEEFFQRRFIKTDLPLVMDTFSFNKKEHGIEANGLIYVSSNENEANNQLFVKRLFVREHFSELLPKWATFAGVIIDCPDLIPTLDRNNVIAVHQTFAILKQSLVNLIIYKLTEYATRRQDTFNRILQAHLKRIQNALIDDFETSPKGNEHFFRSLINFMPFKVISQGSPHGVYMTLSEYRQKFSPSLISQRTSTISASRTAIKHPIYYLREPLFQALVIKKNIPVIPAYTNLEYALIFTYGQAFDNEVEIMDIRNVEDLFLPTRIDQAPWQVLINVYTQMPGGPETVKVTAFEPSSLPGILAVTEIDKKTAQKLEDYIRLGASVLSPQLKNLMEGEVSRIKEGKAAFSFFINSKNQLMEKIRKTISEEGKPSDLIINLLHEMYHNAMEHANVASGLEEHIFEIRTKLLENLLNYSKDSVRLQNELDGMLIELRQLQDFERDHQHCINISLDIPIEPETRYCVVFLSDLTKSTWVLANIDFKDRGDLFNRLILEMKKVVEKHGGFFDKFTGDGLLSFFGLVKPPVDGGIMRKICMNAKVCATEIAAQTDAFFGQEDVRKVLDASGIPAPRSHIALTAGDVAFGRFGGAGTAVGIPVVQAARLVGNKDFFTNNNIICSEKFIRDLGSNLIPESLLKKDFSIEGSHHISVYRLF